MYFTNDEPDYYWKLFHCMPEKDVIIWTNMIVGHSRLGQCCKEPLASISFGGFASFSFFYLIFLIFNFFVVMICVSHLCANQLLLSLDLDD